MSRFHFSTRQYTLLAFSLQGSGFDGDHFFFLVFFLVMKTEDAAGLLCSCLNSSSDFPRTEADHEVSERSAAALQSF